MVTLHFADRYFLSHLRRRQYAESRLVERESALQLANLEIAGETGSEISDDSPFAFAAAVCEQMLYLIEHAEELYGAPVNTLVSESVDGVGSCSYRSAKPEDAWLAPAARRLLGTLPRNCRLARG